MGTRVKIFREQGNKDPPMGGPPGDESHEDEILCR